MVSFGLSTADRRCRNSPEDNDGRHFGAARISTTRDSWTHPVGVQTQPTRHSTQSAHNTSASGWSRAGVSGLIRVDTCAPSASPAPSRRFRGNHRLKRNIYKKTSTGLLNVRELPRILQRRWVSHIEPESMKGGPKRTPMVPKGHPSPIEAGHRRLRLPTQDRTRWVSQIEQMGVPDRIDRPHR